MPSSRRTKRLNDDSIPDDQKSAEAWGKLTLEVLRLKCQANSLITMGKKAELAARLYDHFHPEQIEDILNTEPDDVIVDADANDANGVNDGVNLQENAGGNQEINDDRVPENTRNTAETTDSTVPWADGANNDDDALDQQLRSYVDSRVNDILEELEATKEDLRETRSRQSLVEQENLALRSQIRSLSSKRQQHSNSSNSNAITGPTGSARPVSVRQTLQSNTNSRNTHTVTTTSPSISVPAQSSGGMFSNVSSNHLPNTTAPLIIPGESAPFLASRNPYPLPPLLDKQLKLIENGEYIDFEKIKPNRKAWSEEVGWSLGVADDADGEETVRLKKAKGNLISSFTEWLGAWNQFMFARLHYHPHDQPDLLAYQGAIAQFSTSYKFTAVYAYDIDFRRKMAAERQLAPIHRTTFWATQHLELKNQHLHGQMLTPIYCYTCHENGHMSKACPKKPRKGNFRQPFRNFGLSPAQSSPFLPQQWSQQNNRSPFPPSGPPQPPQHTPPRFLQPNQSPNNATNASPRGSNVTPVLGTCNYLNHKGYCYRGNTCPFKHACNKCGEEGTHGGINCWRNTSTTFRPQFQPNTTS